MKQILEGKCPCDSNKNLIDCCAIIIADHNKAETAEQLMRSRYTAYTLSNNDYLRLSSAEGNQPQEPTDEDDPIQWLGLEIHKCEKGEPLDSKGFVTFTATFLSGATLYQLHEKSSFIRDAGLWYYLGGEEKITHTEISRSAPCPCGSGKKFKRCCCITFSYP